MKIMTKSLLSISLLFSFSQASFSHESDHRDSKNIDSIRISFENKHYSNNHHRSSSEDIRNHIRDSFERTRRHNKTFPGKTIQCGDTITESMTILNDLECPNETGFVLNIIGDNITVKGNGKRITAPNSGSAVFIHGKNVTLSGLVAQEIKNGYGVLAYNSPGVRITQNNFSKNFIGIMIYSDGDAINQPLIKSNNVSESIFAGIRTGFDAPGVVNNPIIEKNIIRNTQGSALHIEAENYELTGNESRCKSDESYSNDIKGSRHGLFLQVTNLNIHDIDLSNLGIPGVTLFISLAKNVVLSNVNLSNNSTDTSIDSIGLDLYRVEKFSIRKVAFHGNDVGIKFETEQGTESQGNVNNCKFVGNSYSGILINSYDSTSYGKMIITGNRFKLNASVKAILNMANVAEGSVLSDN